MGSQNAVGSNIAKLEVFIEHIPRADHERLQARMHAVQLQSTLTSLPGAIAYTVFVYGHIQGVGVTAYRIYNILYCEAGEVEQNVTNNRK